MKRIIAIILFLFPFIGISQNLVPNPSFENIDTCPVIGKIDYAIPWYNPVNTTPNTMNTCASYQIFGFGIPSNLAGYQYPRTGNGYAGIVVFADYAKGRDYISVKLDSV